MIEIAEGLLQLEVKRMEKYHKKLNTVPLEICTENYFDRLPDEMLIEIFWYLSPLDWITTARTCTRFLKISTKIFDFSMRDNFPLIYCSASGYLESVQMILSDCRVDMHDRSNTAIKLASSKGHAEVINSMLSKNPKEVWDSTLIQDCMILALSNRHLKAALQFVNHGLASEEWIKNESIESLKN